nr:MAG TPA: hypothetical protein [Caudoviricetes sp.]DAW14638.1 MAG TPA: hypothetical protein [Caudoviricetes sp.]
MDDIGYKYNFVVLIDFIDICSWPTINETHY